MATEIKQLALLDALLAASCHLSLHACNRSLFARRLSVDSRAYAISQQACCREKWQDTTSQLGMVEGVKRYSLQEADLTKSVRALLYEYFSHTWFRDELHPELIEEWIAYKKRRLIFKLHMGSYVTGHYSILVFFSGAFCLILSLFFLSRWRLFKVESIKLTGTILSSMCYFVFFISLHYVSFVITHWVPN